MPKTCVKIFLNFIAQLKKKNNHSRKKTYNKKPVNAFTFIASKLDCFACSRISHKQGYIYHFVDKIYIYKTIHISSEILLPSKPI